LSMEKMDHSSNEIIVRGSDGCVHWEMDNWLSLVSLASLSAGPRTVAEFTTAMRRYVPDHELGKLGRRGPDLQLEWIESAVSWCVIDLVGRTVIANPAFELPGREATFQSRETKDQGDFHIVWLDLAEDWDLQTATDLHAVEGALRQRYEAARRRRPVDRRGILFGAPCWEYFAQAMLDRPDGLKPVCVRTEDGLMCEVEATQEMHRAWLMTPRPDLDGLTPREVLLHDRERLQKDLEHRADQWSQQLAPPLPLSRDSYAYHHGYFGTTEVYLYFFLVRHVLQKGWERLYHESYPPTVADLASYLESQSQRWLKRRDVNDDSMPPRDQIDLERQRLPRQVQPHDVFDDCPLCRAQAEGTFGPSFMWIYDFALDFEEEFAFSMYTSHEDWEIAQGDYCFEDDDELDDQQDDELDDEQGDEQEGEQEDEQEVTLLDGPSETRVEQGTHWSRCDPCTPPRSAREGQPPATPPVGNGIGLAPVRHAWLGFDGGP